MKISDGIGEGPLIGGPSTAFDKEAASYASQKIVNTALHCTVWGTIVRLYHFFVACNHERSSFPYLYMHGSTQSDHVIISFKST